MGFRGNSHAGPPALHPVSGAGQVEHPLETRSCSDVKLSVKQTDGEVGWNEHLESHSPVPAPVAVGCVQGHTAKRGLGSPSAPRHTSLRQTAPVSTGEATHSPSYFLFMTKVT